jgi:hypothetical protein
MAFPRKDGSALASFMAANPAVKHRLAKMDKHNLFQVNFTTLPNATNPISTTGTAHCRSYLPNAPNWEGINNIKIFVWQPCEYRVILGGQVGADEGVLCGAITGITTAGYMPKGFKCVGGLDPELATKYNLCETAYGQGSDADRDCQNIDNSDLLVTFLVDKPMTGRGMCYMMMYTYTGKHQSGMCVGPMLDHYPKPALVCGFTKNYLFIVYDLSEENWEVTADALWAVI